MAGSGHVTPNHQLGRGGSVAVAIYGPVYGFNDFEAKVTEAIQRARRKGRNV